MFFILIFLLSTFQSPANAFDLETINFVLNIDSPQTIKSILLLGTDSIFVEQLNGRTSIYSSHKADPLDTSLAAYGFFPKDTDITSNELIDNWLNNIQDSKTQKLISKEKLKDNNGVFFITQYYIINGYEGHALYLDGNTVYSVIIRTVSSDLESLKNDTLLAISKIAPRKRK